MPNTPGHTPGHAADPSVDPSAELATDLSADRPVATADGAPQRPGRRPSPAAVVGLAALGTVSSLAVAGVAFADRGGDWGYRGGGRHWWGVGGLLLMLALVAATVALTMLLVGRRVPTATSPAAGVAVPPPPLGPLAGAEAILAERLARGEIGPDDYRASVAALRGQPADLPVDPPASAGSTDASSPS